MSVREVGARLVLDIKDAEAKIKQLEKELKDIEKSKLKFDANTNELEKIKARLEEIKKEKEALERQKLSLKVDLDNIANLKNQLLDVKDDISELKKELLALSNKKLSIDIDLKANANEIHDVINDMTLGENDKNDKLKGLYSAREALKYDMREVGIEIDEVQKKINNLNKEKIKIEANISELNDAQKLVYEIYISIADLYK